jgi:hypothetical protein
MKFWYCNTFGIIEFEIIISQNYISSGLWHFIILAFQILECRYNILFIDTTQIQISKSKSQITKCQIPNPKLFWIWTASIILSKF